MGITVTGTDDAAQTLAETQDFLATRPVEHNLVHTLLARRASEPHPGRYWVAHDQDRVVAVAFLSPLGFHATLTPATDEIVDRLVEVVAHEVPELAGVNGGAPTTVRFAGRWGAARHTPVTAAEAQRLYRLGGLRPPDVGGSLRRARGEEVDLVARWQAGFNDDTGEGSSDRDPDGIRAAMAELVTAQRLFVWDDDGPRSMAALSPMLAGAVRVQGVYTPPELRGHGYTSAVVAAVSAHGIEHGAAECLLYTQLSNPTSNAIYRAIGYEPVSEILRYRFG